MPDVTDDTAIESLEQVVRNHVLLVLVRCNWSISRAAKVLKVCEKTIYNYRNRFELEGIIERGPQNIGWRIKEQKGAG